MRLDLGRFADPGLSADFIEYLVRDEAPARALHFERLWAYYKNDLSTLGLGPPEGDRLSGDALASARPYVQAQEFGLPARITGRSHLGYGGTGVPQPAFTRKEVVIENDIGWRIDTGIHFLAGKPFGTESLARRADLARTIEAALAAVWQASGGLALIQEIALLGAVYGFVDLVIRMRSAEFGVRSETPPDPFRIPHSALPIVIEAVEAPRVLPILQEDDYRRLRYWVQVYRRQANRVARPSARHGVFGPAAGRIAEDEVLEIIGPAWWQRYEGRPDEGGPLELAAEGPNRLGRPSVVHIQNLASPMHYEGAGEVEPLIPLQDELNTRLSDRAGRVTFQSFKMYLGKGIEGFEDRPVAPGRMWATDNPDASIEAFGGDADCPSEDAHVEELRQALDKVSGVTPLAAGLLRDSLGNLTSATALRVVLAGTLARLQRKRITYGDGIIEANRMVLEALDALGLLRTEPEDRQTRLHWPDPLPEDLERKLAEAKAKRDLGVPAETVLRELGYAPGEGGRAR
jgi:hypothetical protein